MKDVETLKLERESKFKVQSLNLEGGGSILDDQLKKELVNMRIQHESLFEKVQLNSDKLVAIEIEMNNLQKIDKKMEGNGKFGMNNSPFSEDFKAQ